MPKVRWDIDASDIDDFDRESSFKPYQGPVPPNAVYQWRIKHAKYVAGDRRKVSQLRVGLELVPRDDRKDEKRFKGYFIMVFLPVTSKTAFRYVPFLDAIGVSGADFKERTITDAEGNITKIGRWRNTGDTVILGNLVERPDQNDVLKKEVAWMGPLEDEDEDPLDDDDDYADDEDDSDEEDDSEDDDFEDDPAPPRRGAKRPAAKAVAKPTRRRKAATDDYDDDDDGDPF